MFLKYWSERPEVLKELGSVPILWTVNVSDAYLKTDADITYIALRLLNLLTLTQGLIRCHKI